MYKAPSHTILSGSVTSLSIPSANPPTHFPLSHTFRSQKPETRTAVVLPPT